MSMDRLFRDLVAQLLRRWGFSYNEAYVYAVLLLSSKPLTIGEVSSITGLSKSAVSTILKKLSSNFMVVTRRKGRIKYFTPRIVFVEKFLEQPREMLEKEVKPLEKIVRELAENADEKHRKRLEELLADLERLECILTEINRLEQSLTCNEKPPENK